MRQRTTDNRRHTRSLVITCTLLTPLFCVRACVPACVRADGHLDPEEHKLFVDYSEQLFGAANRPAALRTPARRTRSGSSIFRRSSSSQQR